ncbi:MAG TPA: HEAT repeat domain-containing protein [Terriglobia bacterium]|nr:HEAT repeat domain-containing protein [Terriglobia bacterium]
MMRSLHRRDFLKVATSGAAMSLKLPSHSASSAEEAARSEGRSVDVWVSAGDNWWFGTWLALDSPASIRDSVQMWSDVLHVKRVYWRGQQEEMMIDHALVRKENLDYYEFMDRWERYLIKEVGVNHALVDEAHKHDMEVYIWAPLFDYGGLPDYGGTKEWPYFSQIKLTLEHPEWMPVDRYGFRRQNGPIELSYPEARKALIDMYLEYLKVGNYDGITFFTYAENYGMRFEDEFGFNQPIVDEYKRRYGVDIRTQDFDANLWRYLRGEYVTQFLREFKSALAPYSKQLGVCLNPREPNYPQPWNVPSRVLTAGRIYMDWERWVRDGTVDELHIYGGAPAELQRRTFDNVLRAVQGTKVRVEHLTSGPFAESLRPYVAQGVRMDLFATDEASYIKAGYPEQSVDALTGQDIYATMRVLAQVIDGKTKVSTELVIPLTNHDNILIRRMALKALGALKDPKAVPVIESALEDRETSVRAAAAHALLEVNGSQSVTKLIEAVKKYNQFQLAEAVGATLSSIDPRFLPEIARAGSDRNVVVRRMVMAVLGRRGAPQGVGVLLTGLKDEDAYVRFRAAHALQVFGSQPHVVEALIGALKDPDVVVQNRAAESLAIGLIKGSTVEPRLGLEAAIRILATPTGPLEEIQLNSTQRHVLDALTEQFRRFGDGSTRSDIEWGFRPVGNSILAFGAEGGRRLQAMIEQKKDRRLADLAWQVLYIRQGMEDFCPLRKPDQEAARIYGLRPGVAPGQAREAPSPIKYSPLVK